MKVWLDLFQDVDLLQTKIAIVIGFSLHLIIVQSQLMS